MEENVTFSVQMEDKASPVILINKFQVNGEEVGQFLERWVLKLRL
ncbi:MAG TPA: hypothetical protein VEL11_18580 [Candidatus Bathyarchaeia archaeon]|nr:hypothetical protein [Candidatus Bathyarchaeia archaeon]